MFLYVYKKGDNKHTVFISPLLTPHILTLLSHFYQFNSSNYSIIYHSALRIKVTFFSHGPWRYMLMKQGKCI